MDVVLDGEADHEGHDVGDVIVEYFVNRAAELVEVSGADLSSD
jgi:hypothetical protein